MLNLLKETAITTGAIMAIGGFISYVLSNLFNIDFDSPEANLFFDLHRVEFILSIILLVISIAIYISNTRKTFELTEMLNSKIDMLAKGALEGQIANFYHRHITDNKPFSPLDVKELHNLEEKRKILGLNSYTQSRMGIMLEKLHKNEEDLID